MRRHLGILWLGCCLAWLTAGCAGPKGAGASRFAAVEITAGQPELIGLAAEQVFGKAGYSGGGDPRRMVFTQDSGVAGNLLYGGWEPGQSSLRVEAYIERLGDRRYLLWCEAFQMRNAGDSILEEKRKLSRARRGKYQEYLEQVKRLVEPLPAK
jgi:hypothetical protein